MIEKIKAVGGLAVLILLDQLAKIWALTCVKEKGPIPILADVLEFYYVENRGAAFGILQNKQWIFLIIGIIILAAMIWIMPKIPKERYFQPLRLSLYFICAGAVGNMIDRLVRRYVVDFIYFKLIDFPVFNVADIYVTCAAFALIFLLLFYYKDEDINRIFPKK